MSATRRTSITPGQVWLDTDGNRIHAHGGSILTVHDGSFLWYGENKERTVPGAGVWHWGMRAYRSRDLHNWEDLGTFAHVHPPPTGRPGELAVSLSFPTAGRYIVNAEFRRQGEMAEAVEFVLAAAKQISNEIVHGDLP